MSAPNSDFDIIFAGGEFSSDLRVLSLSDADNPQADPQLVSLLVVSPQPLPISRSS